MNEQAEDAAYIARALRLAEKGQYLSHPNPSVGCVLVRQGNIVGQGYTSIAGQGHAEANALAAAGADARGATAYVTLEPCSFHGRTPSCAHALVEAGVSRVVVCTLDPDQRNAGNGLQVLKDAGIDVIAGVMQSSAEAQLKGHIKRLTAGRPYVRLKLGMTLDGKTALANGESRWITSPEARADVQRLRARSAAIVTGVQTVIDDDPAMTLRENELDIDEKDLAMGVVRPVYIVDSSLRTPRDAQLLRRPETVMVAANDLTEEPFKQEVLVLPDPSGKVDLAALMSELARREHSEVLVECGATLAGAMLTAQVVDELVVYMAPRLIGGAGRSLLNLPEIDRMSDLVDLTITEIRQIGTDIRIIAQPVS